MKYPALSHEEAKAQAADGLFPKVTEDLIRSKIADVRYHWDGLLCICVIEMKNGFMTLGKSAAADPRNHNEEIGRRYAFEDAFKPLWQLEGYLLRERLSQ